MSLLAHAAPGFQSVGLSPGLVLYLTAAGVGLVALGLRARVPAVDPVERTDAWPGQGQPAWAGIVFGTVGVAGLVATLVCAWAGSELLGDNPVPVAVFTIFWIGGQLVAVVLGDLWRLVDPFDHVAGVVFPRPRRSGVDAWWLPALLLASFGWMWLAWPDGATRPRSIAWWLTGYCVVIAIGALLGGREWVRRHEAFAVAFGLLATVSPVDWSGARPRLRNPVASLGQRVLDRREGAVLAVLLGVALFDAVSFTQWWADLLGVRSIAGYTAFNTLGLVWLIATAAVAWVAVAKLAGLVAGEPVELGLRLAAPVAALAAGYALSHEIGFLLNDLRVFLLQATDPLSRGWDLFGIGDWRPQQVASASVQSWSSLVLFEAGVFLALPGLHRRALARFGAVGGTRALWVFAAFVLAAAIIGLKLLVGL